MTHDLFQSCCGYFNSPSSPQSSSASSSSVSVDLDFPKFLSFFRFAAARRRAVIKREYYWLLQQNISTLGVG